MKHHLQKTTHERLITLFSFAVVLVASLGATTWSNALYILTGVEDAAIVLDGSQEAPDLGSRMVYIPVHGAAPLAGGESLLHEVQGPARADGHGERRHKPLFGSAPSQK